MGRRFLWVAIRFLEGKDDEIGLGETERGQQSHMTEECLKTIPFHYGPTFIPVLGTEAEGPTVKGPKRRP